MGSDMVRKHFLLPRELAKELEEVAGERRQSETVCRIIEQWLKNQRLNRVVQKYAGSSRPEDHPEWADDAAVTRAIQELRAEARPAGDPRAIDP